MPISLRVRADLLPHETVPRAEAPSGFATFLTPSALLARAEAEAVDCTVAEGDVVVIGGRVVHGSHAPTAGERIAFSPLFEFDGGA